MSTSDFINRWATAAIAAALLLSGCNSDPTVEDSGRQKTHELIPDIIASPAIEGDSVNIEVRLKNSASSTIRLSEGDALYATTLADVNNIQLEGDLFGEMVRITDEYKGMDEGRSGDVNFLGLIKIPANDYWYSVNFATPAADAEYTVIFKRAGYTDAPASKLTLPPAFSVTAPINNGDPIYSRLTDNIALNWTPADSQSSMNIEASTECADGSNKTWSQTLATDSGSSTLPAAALSDATLIGNCAIRITFQRIRAGQLDPAFNQGGHISGRQSVTIVIKSTD